MNSLWITNANLERTSRPIILYFFDQSKYFSLYHSLFKQGNQQFDKFYKHAWALVRSTQSSWLITPDQIGVNPKRAKQSNYKIRRFKISFQLYSATLVRPWTYRISLLLFQVLFGILQRQNRRIRGHFRLVLGILRTKHTSIVLIARLIGIARDDTLLAMLIYKLFAVYFHFSPGGKITQSRILSNF